MPETHVLFDQNKSSAPAASPAPPITPAASPPERDPSTGKFLRAGLSPVLARQARESGLDDADLKEMSVEDIRGHVQDWKWEQRLEKVWQRDERSRQTARTPSPEGPVTAETGLDIKTTEEDPDRGYDPGIVGALRKIHQRLEALEQRFTPVEGHVHAQAKQANESFSRRMERFYAKHPETYGSFKMTGDETKDKDFKESPEFFARLQTYAAWKKAGSDLDSLEETLEAEHQGRFGRRAPEPEHDDDDEVTEWENGVLGRPTQHNGQEEPPGKEKAVQGLKSSPVLNGATRAPKNRPPRGQYLKH